MHVQIFIIKTFLQIFLTHSSFKKKIHFKLRNMKNRRQLNWVFVMILHDCCVTVIDIQFFFFNFDDASLNANYRITKKSKLINHVWEDIRICNSVEFRDLTDNVLWQSCNILALLILIFLIVIRDFRVIAFHVVDSVFLVLTLQKLSESLKIISAFMLCFVFVFAFLHKLLSCRQMRAID